ncbi:hypothetical protein OAG50_03095, partial [Akkermansiaceae bacterium]|nr:hypothetical protein [Akkermansiaceae bacterium]
MKRSLITFTLLSSLLPAQVTEKKEDSAMSRLPVGATLTNVSVPRFDDKKRRTSLLTAKTMSVESEEELKGKGLTIYLFDKEQKVSSTAKMAAATYLVNKEQLAATGELLLRATNDEFLARGQSGLLALSSRQGILLGRAETMFIQKEKKPKKTAMTLPTSIAPLLAGLQMLTAAPPLVTTEELVEFEKQVAPRVIPNIDPRADVEQAEENEANLTQRLANFLSLVGQSRVLAQAAAPVAPEVPFEDLFKPNKKRIIIKADGFYFDGENSEFSYLGNTTLTGRGITMTSKEGMKVLFDPPKEKQVAKKDEADLLGGFKGIGEMKQFTATGGIEINGKDKDGQPIRVRGSRAVYDAKAQKIIL